MRAYFPLCFKTKNYTFMVENPKEKVLPDTF